jgi:hypothetical protein
MEDNIKMVSQKEWGISVQNGERQIAGNYENGNEMWSSVTSW